MNVINSQKKSDQMVTRLYKQFLLQFTNLYDQAWYSPTGERIRNSNDKLEDIRNNPFHTTGLYRQRPASKPPTLIKITKHLKRFSGGNKEDTIFFCNSDSFRTLLCLVDIDSDSSEASQQLAEYVAKTWLRGDAFIDRSPGGSGKHVYFKVDVTEDKVNKLTAEEVRMLLLELKHSIQADPFVKSFIGATVCSLLGEPTYWSKDNGVWKIEHRGSVVKAPYFCDGVGESVDLFIKLRSFPLVAVKKCLKKSGVKKDSSISPSSPSPLAKADMGVTTPPFNKLNGREKKRVCVKALCRKLNRQVTVDEAIEEYERAFNPTGFSPKDIERRLKEMAEMVGFYNKTFKPSSGHGRHQFEKDRYLAICKQLVPADSFKWSRRELLNHNRLADFVGIKLQDAFFAKEHHVGRASRDATIANMRVMKAKGWVDWIVNNHMYRRLLDLAVAHQLLTVYDDYVQPFRSSDGDKLCKGAARMIGPGAALKEEHQEFRQVYETFLLKKAESEYLVA